MEVLRLYPPAFGISKQAMEGGIQLGEYFIPGGTSLFVSLYSSFHLYSCVSIQHACGVIAHCGQTSKDCPTHVNTVHAWVILILPSGGYLDDIDNQDVVEFVLFNLKHHPQLCKLALLLY